MTPLHTHSHTQSHLYYIDRYLAANSPTFVSLACLQFIKSLSLKWLLPPFVIVYELETQLKKPPNRLSQLLYTWLVDCSINLDKF